MLETIGGDFMPLIEHCADLVRVDVCEYRGNREGCPQAVTLEHDEKRREALIGAELGLRRREIGDADAITSGSHAQIDGDRDAATGTLRPADFVVGEALLIRDRVAFLPRHISPLLGLKRPATAAGIFRGTNAPPP